MATRIMYMEKKEAAFDKQGRLLGGDARIGRVTFSKTKKSIHYCGKTFMKFNGYKANFFELETGDHYWISGCKKDGGDRLYGERVPIHIDDDVKIEYWTEIRELPGCVDIKVRNDRH